MDFENRRKALMGMAEELGEVSFSKRLVEAYMRDTWFLKKDIYNREILSPIRIMEAIGRRSVYTQHFDVDPECLRPLGRVAILLPKNGINLLISKAVCSSFLAGNQTLVKFPGKLTHSYCAFKQWVEKHLPGVHFVPQEMTSEKFLREAIISPDIDAIVIYGDDKWIWGYKDLVRRHGTKLIFEGPGKDPQVILPDADLDLAVSDAIEGGLLNGGQSCSATERFFVHKAIEEEFIERLSDRLGQLKIGAPDDDETDLGPIESTNVLHRLSEQVKDACLRGGKVVRGGKTVEVNGSGKHAFEPTVVRDCTGEMKIFREENFGPVFPVMSFNSVHDLLLKLDDSNYGLNASVYGSCPPEVSTYLDSSHRNIYFNSTVSSVCNVHSRILDGGYKNSGLIWEWKGSNFLQREGRRLLIKELNATP